MEFNEFWEQLINEKENKNLIHKLNEMKYFINKAYSAGYHKATKDQLNEFNKMFKKVFKECK